MSEVILITAQDPGSLLHAAAEGFISSPSGDRVALYPSPDYCLVVRQGGVREDLYRYMSQAGVPGWFDPPLYTFQEIPLLLLEERSHGRSVGDFERVVLVSNLLKATSGRVFPGGTGAGGYTEPVDRLLGHLISEGIRAEHMEECVDRARYQGEFERLRDKELAAIYSRYLDLLESLSLRDPRQDLIRCADLIDSQPETLSRALGGRREIRIYGLLDLRAGWKRLLRALHETPALDRVEIYADEQVHLPFEFPFSSTRLPADHATAIRLFDDGSARSEPSGLEILEAPNTERELGEVVGRIRDLLDAGTDPGSIAVVTRSARPYVDHIIRYARRFGVPVTARVRLAYAEIPVVRALLGLFAAAADGWTRRTLIELADGPYFDGILDARVINHIGFRQRVSGLGQWSEAIVMLGDSEDQLLPSEITRQRVARARDGLRRFRVTADQLNDERSVLRWIEWLMDFMDSDPWDVEGAIYRVPFERYDIIKRDLTGWRGLERILSEWRSAEEEFERLSESGSTPVRAANFHARLLEMLAGDAGIWTETFRGVVVTETLAHAYRSFDHVFLVGLEAGNFPARRARSPLLDDSAVKLLNDAGLNLESREEWDLRERVLFGLLINGAGHRTVSYSRIDINGREAIRSTFVEALISATGITPVVIEESGAIPAVMPLVRSWDQVGRIVVAARVEQSRETGALTAYNGLIEHEPGLRWLREKFEEHYLWSPTQLEAYARCPWAYFSRYLLGLDRREEPADEIDARLRGNIIHRALKLVYDRAADELGKPVFLRDQHSGWLSSNIPDVVGTVVDQLSETSWMGHPGLRHAAVRDLTRVLDSYLRWEVQHNEDMFNRRKRKAPRILRTGVVAHELGFPRAVLERGGTRISYRGTIDRLEIGIDERIDNPEAFVAVIDYKMTTASTPGAGAKEAWDDGVVLQLPLYAHALAQLTPEQRPSRAEYRSVRGREVVHALEMQGVDPKSEIRVPDESQQEKFERALGKAVDSAVSVRSGAFPPQPAPSCGCPPFCHARDICRVAGGPRKAPRKWR